MASIFSKYKDNIYYDKYGLYDKSVLILESFSLM